MNNSQLLLGNKMGNPSNGPAAVTWLIMFVLMVIRALGVNWAHLVTLFIVKFFDLGL